MFYERTALSKQQEETVWLTQQLLAELFQTTMPNISMHICNIFDEGELTLEATIKKFLPILLEGICEVQWNLDCYNLDMIISVRPITYVLLFTVLFIISVLIITVFDGCARLS